MRFLPHTQTEIDQMLDAIGIGSIDDLFRPVPEHLRLDGALRVPEPLGEMALDAHMKRLADANRIRRETPSFLGAGLYEHYVPHVVRQLVLRAEFLTSYTPYQPEISQGTLKAMFEYQSMMAALLGLDVANASMYDGATAATEGALMALRLTRRSALVTSGTLHPEYREFIDTHVGHTAEVLSPSPMTDGGITDVHGLATLLADHPDIGAVVVQSPNFFGVIEPLEEISAVCQASGALLVVTFNEPLAYGLLKPPGACGAAIAAGEAISMGSSIGFGGPSLGVFAARKEFVRQMPGRLAGQTVDTRGREGYVLTLSTREQHIRRERATSNICTNQGLCATAAAIYLCLLGKEGLVKLAQINLSKAEYAKRVLSAIPGVTLRYEAPTFNEFTLRLPTDATQIVESCANNGILVGVPLGRHDDSRTTELLVAVTELHSKADIDRLAQEIAEALA